MNFSNYPDDDNGDALRNMEKSSDDLSKSRDIDFSVVFESEDSANSFIGIINESGNRAELHAKETGSVWDVTVTIPMAPSHGGITAVEDRLSRLATPLRGWNDGGDVTQFQLKNSRLSPRVPMTVHLFKIVMAKRSANDIIALLGILGF